MRTCAITALSLPKFVRSIALGNPFKTFTHTEPAHQSVVRQYRGWLKERIQAKDPAVCQELNRLKQKALIGDLVLACWCKPLSCHGDVIKQYLEWAISNNVTFGA